MTPEIMTRLLYALAQDRSEEKATAEMLPLLVSWGNLRECEGKMKAGKELLESLSSKGL